MDFYCRVMLTCVAAYVFRGVNEIEAMYEASRMNVKFEPGSTFTFTLDLSFIASIYIYARSHVKITQQRKSFRP